MLTQICKNTIISVLQQFRDIKYSKVSLLAAEWLLNNHPKKKKKHHHLIDAIVKKKSLAYADIG